MGVWLTFSCTLECLTLLMLHYGNVVVYNTSPSPSDTSSFCPSCTMYLLQHLPLQHLRSRKLIMHKPFMEGMKRSEQT